MIPLYLQSFNRLRSAPLGHSLHLRLRRCVAHGLRLLLPFDFTECNAERNKKRILYNSPTANYKPFLKRVQNVFFVSFGYLYIAKVPLSTAQAPYLRLLRHALQPAWLSGFWRSKAFGHSGKSVGLKVLVFVKKIKKL